MLDRATFLRPTAHRGLHDAARGVVENSARAFEAALERGLGIECDLQQAADGTAMVFHDVALDRLVDARGDISDYSPAELAGFRYRLDRQASIMRLADLLDLVGGRVPLLIEVKSEWEAPDPRFMASIAEDLKTYSGPAAVMSFDPAVMASLKPLLPHVPRGIVSGLYDETWWPGKLSKERAFQLSHMIASRPAEPDFFAYHVKALPTPVTRFLREGLGIPLFTWTVRTDGDLAMAAQWADAPIFEDLDPTFVQTSLPR